MSGVGSLRWAHHGQLVWLGSGRLGGRVVFGARFVFGLQHARVVRIARALVGARVLTARRRLGVVLVGAGDARLRLLQHVVGLLGHQRGVRIVGLLVVVDDLFYRDFLLGHRVRRLRRHGRGFDF